MGTHSHIGKVFFRIGRHNFNFGLWTTAKLSPRISQISRIFPVFLREIREIRGKNPTASVVAMLDWLKKWARGSPRM
jgi:hypothetical protein